MNKKQTQTQKPKHGGVRIAGPDKVMGRPRVRAGNDPLRKGDTLKLVEMNVSDPQTGTLTITLVKSDDEFLVVNDMGNLYLTTITRAKHDHTAIS